MFGFSVGFCNFRATAYMDDAVGQIRLKVDNLSDNSPYGGYFCISHPAENATGYSLEHSMRLENDFTLGVSRKHNVIAHIDPKYLPTTVPVIQSASVGQTIVVKAVDEDGKPTEWEAVDTAKKFYFYTNPNWREFTTNVKYEELLAEINTGNMPTVIVKETEEGSHVGYFAFTTISAVNDTGIYMSLHVDSEEGTYAVWFKPDGTITNAEFI